VGKSLRKAKEAKKNNKIPISKVKMIKLQEYHLIPKEVKYYLLERVKAKKRSKLKKKKRRH